MSSWTRVEATARTVELTGGLEARVADPLWLLARQWQVGEFRGDDAAQPCAAQVTYRSAPLDLPTGAPAEAGVTAAPEPTRGAAGLHAAVRAGQGLRRLLEADGLAVAADALSAQFRPRLPAAPVAVGPHGLTRAAVLARLGIDGRAVAGPPTEVLERALAGLRLDQRSAALAVITTWAAAYSAVAAGSVPTTWDDERLEYTFEASATPALATITVRAPEHPGGSIDWHTFDLPGTEDQRVPKTPRQPGPVRSTEVEEVMIPHTPVRSFAAIPTPVRYTGMPVSRWFEFEDGRVNFGELEAGSADVARLLVAEFAMSYSDDWFLLPLRLNVGTLTEVSSLRVVDNFGDSTPVSSTALNDSERLDAQRPWRLFELERDTVSRAHPAPWLLLPPGAVGDLTGPPVERVVLARDEAANLAWGIEQQVEGPAGRAVERATQWPGRAPGGDSETGDLWRYRLESTAPPWWIPFVAERVTADRPDVRLRRARMESWRLIAGGPVGPQSELLDPSRPVWLYEEEVPNTGIAVDCRWRYARWSDGSTHLWRERAKRPSTGNRSSGVRWDLIDSGSPPPPGRV